MDAGTNALDVLTGRVFPLKLGFIGVVNRSQQDILTNKSMNEALKAEQRFFQRHPAYKSIANQCGTPYLEKQLNNVSNINIPAVKFKINKKNKASKNNNNKLTKEIN